MFPRIFSFLTCSKDRTFLNLFAILLPHSQEKFTFLSFFFCCCFCSEEWVVFSVAGVYHALSSHSGKNEGKTEVSISIWRLKFLGASTL